MTVFFRIVLTPLLWREAAARSRRCPRASTMPKTQEQIQHKVALGATWKDKSASGLTTLRYGFKTTSVDWKKPGRVTTAGGKAEVRMPKLMTAGTPAPKSGAETVFVGSVEAHKSTVCLLIQMEDGSYHLERAHRNIKNLTTERDQPFLAKRRA